jgi:tetratricopeptide (TPR) repeat protein
MTSTDHKTKLAYAICDHLKRSAMSGDDQEGIEVAIQCISSAFSIDASDESLSVGKPLLDIFTEYLTLNPVAKPVAKKVSTAEARAKADLLKGEGNKKMAARAYNEAISLYTQAIDLDENAVYYANRGVCDLTQLLPTRKTETTTLPPKMGVKRSRLILDTRRAMRDWGMHFLDSRSLKMRLMPTKLDSSWNQRTPQ